MDEEKYIEANKRSYPAKRFATNDNGTYSIRCRHPAKEGEFVSVECAAQYLEMLEDKCEELGWGRAGLEEDEG